MISRPLGSSRLEAAVPGAGSLPTEACGISRSGAPVDTPGSSGGSPGEPSEGAESVGHSWEASNAFGDRREPSGGAVSSPCAAVVGSVPGERVTGDVTVTVPGFEAVGRVVVVIGVPVAAAAAGESGAVGVTRVAVVAVAAAAEVCGSAPAAAATEKSEVLEVDTGEGVTGVAVALDMTGRVCMHVSRLKVSRQATRSSQATGEKGILSRTLERYIG